MKHFLIDQGKREVLDKERAEQLLDGLGEGIASVKFSGKSFGDGSAEVAAEALRAIIPTLTYLDLADIIASRPEEEAKRTLGTIAQALATCKHLEYIDLSDNALGAKGIRAVGDLLAGQSRLRQLFLCNNGLAADAGNLITKALLETMPTSLVKLHFHNNLLETAGAVALAPVVENSPHLIDLRFSSLRITRDGAVHICKSLKLVMSSTLRCLNVSDNSFGDEGATALAEVLRDAPVLEKLQINDLSLGDEGVQLVCDALVEGAPRLEVLDISANDLGPEGAKGLARLLAVGRLIEVRAEDNELGNSGAVRVAKGVAKSATLQSLDISGSEIGSRGAIALATAASKVSSLESLLLDRNSISEDTISEMEALLKDKLGSLDDNDDDEEADDGETDDDDDDDGDDDGDEADTDKAVRSGDTADNVDGTNEAEVDDLVAQVETLGL